LLHREPVAHHNRHAIGGEEYLTSRIRMFLAICVGCYLTFLFGLVLSVGDGGETYAALCYRIAVGGRSDAPWLLLHFFVPFALCVIAACLAGRMLWGQSGSICSQSRFDRVCSATLYGLLIIYIASLYVLVAYTNRQSAAGAALGFGGVYFMNPRISYTIWFLANTGPFASVVPFMKLWRGREMILLASVAHVMSVLCLYVYSQVGWSSWNVCFGPTVLCQLAAWCAFRDFWRVRKLENLARSALPT